MFVWFLLHFRVVDFIVIELDKNHGEKENHHFASMVRGRTRTRIMWFVVVLVRVVFGWRWFFTRTRVRTSEDQARGQAES